MVNAFLEPSARCIGLPRDYQRPIQNHRMRLGIVASRTEEK